MEEGISLIGVSMPMKTMFHMFVMMAITLFLLVERVHAEQMASGSLKCQHVSRVRLLREMFIIYFPDSSDDSILFNKCSNYLKPVGNSSEKYCAKVATDTFP